MNLKLDSNKLKAIWQKVNLALLVVAILSATFCCITVYGLFANPDPEELRAQCEKTQAEIPVLQTRIEEQTAVVEQAEQDAQALLITTSENKASVQREVDTVTEERDSLQALVDAHKNSEEVFEQMRQNIADIRVEYGTAVRELEDKILAGESKYRICYLTFDDGPSYYTTRFLDKIDELDIYVTFFTIGKQLPQSQYALRDSCLRREALSGHSICNHTYTHAINSGLYNSKASFMDAVQKQEDTVYAATGIKTDIVRFPAGSYYCPHRKSVIAELTEKGYGWIDWSANAFDSGTNVKTSAYIRNTVVWQVRQEKISVVLMHDWRLETLGALDYIVNTLKAENYLFLPLFKESSTVGTVYPKWDN